MLVLRVGHRAHRLQRAEADRDAVAGFHLAAIGVDVGRAGAAEGVGPQRQQVGLELTVDEELIQQVGGVDRHRAAVIVLIGQADVAVEVDLRVQCKAAGDPGSGPGRRRQDGWALSIPATMP